MNSSAVGLSKGTLGLVCKPTKGTIDLVTQTTQGVSNTPSTMYIALSNMLKRGSAHIESSDHYLCELEGQPVYLNRQLLKHQLLQSELLSTLLYKSELHLT